MNAESSRICPFCAESINPAAKLCPRCRQWLTMRSLRNPAIFLWVHGGLSAAVFILMGFGFLSAVNRLGNPKPYYTAFPQVLRVVESRMNWAQTKDGLRIYLTGILTNQSPVAWGSIEFDCRFFDAKGVMVDAANAHASLTIQPNDDAAFRAVVAPGGETNDYHSYKLSIITARNAKAWF
jgi:hypothetical protein